MTAPAHEDKVERFIGYLETLEARKDRGVLAALRRCLAFDPEEFVDPRPYRYLGPFLEGSPWEQRAYWLTAGLYAFHPTDRPGTDTALDLPTALARLYQDGQEAIEARFRALLEAAPDQLPDRLRRVVSIVRSKGLRLDYRALLRDLLAWGHPRRRVQRRWARAFYGRIASAGP